MILNLAGRENLPGFFFIGNRTLFLLIIEFK